MVERAKVTTKLSDTKRENSVSKTQRTGFSQSINSPIDHILFLQRTIGNQAVQRLFKNVCSPLSAVSSLMSSVGCHRSVLGGVLSTIGGQRTVDGGHLQAKLKIGQPNDFYEQEADRVAEQVMTMSEPTIQPKPT